VDESGCWWQRPFKLAQRIQGIPGALDVGPGPFISAGVVQVFRDAIGADEADVNEDVFYDRWIKVQVPGGQGALECAHAAAVTEPITLLPPVIPTKFLTLVMSVAYHLQRFRGPEPILLPVEALGRLMGTSARTISAATSLGAHFGLLEPLSGEWAYAKRKAKEWRFNLASGAYQAPWPRIIMSRVSA
jgi:hypothetical protein